MGGNSIGSGRPCIDRDATCKTLKLDRAVARRREILEHLGSIGSIATEVDFHNIVADRLDAQSVELLNVDPCSRASCDGTNLRDDRLGVGICRAVRVGLTDLTPSDHRQLRSRDMHRIAQALVLRDILPGLKRNNSGTGSDVPQE